MRGESRIPPALTIAPGFTTGALCRQFAGINRSLCPCRREARPNATPGEGLTAIRTESPETKPARRATAGRRTFRNASDQTFMSKPRCLATVKMSLSPRPHMFITMIWSFGSVGRDLHHMRQRMAGLQRRDDAFQLAAQLERLQRLGVGDADIFRPAHVVQPGMLRPDARIVETRPRSRSPPGSARRRPATDRSGCHAARRGARRSGWRNAPSGHRRPCRPPRPR